MRRMIWVACFLAAAMLSAGCVEDRQPVQPVRSVRVYTVTPTAATESRTFPGKVKAGREVALAFRVSGQVEQLDVNEGDAVEQGTLIAMLDQRDYLAAVADLEARLQGARSVLNEARLTKERNAALLKDSVVAQSAYDAASSAYESSLAGVRSLEQSLSRARLNLQYSRLEAPFGGVIAVKNVDNHQFVQAKETIVQLEDNSSLDVVVAMPEAVRLKLFHGRESGPHTVSATFEALPGRSFPLRLKEYQTVADSGTQTYEVTLSMDNPGGLGLQPGMTAEVTVAMPGDEDASPLSVPFSSVAGEPGGPLYVWVLGRDGVVARREVKVGRIVNDMFQVEEGVAPGEVIVAAGVDYLHEGQKVRVLEGRIGGRE